jgi:polysaccharide export outer membrane protein
MKKTSLNLFILIFVFALTSCVTAKKLTYLQADDITSSDTIVSVTPDAYKILSYDNLYIKVVTPDPKWSEMFNTISQAYGASSLTDQSADLISYPVDGDGYISLPYIGKIMVSGKTLAEATTAVAQSLEGFIADPAVTVKMINNYVSIIGEVNNPGKFAIYKDRLTIFQALAMASEMTDFSDRQKVQIIRPTKYGNIIKDFSLSDRSIMSTEFYYVMPNDVIYALPMKGRFFHMNEFPYTIILSAVTTFVLLWNVIK